MTMQEEFRKWIATALSAEQCDPFHVWQAAYRAGQAEMMERAAKVANEFIGADPIMDRIRALSVE